jgi:hypothetical protein
MKGKVAAVYCEFKYSGLAIGFLAGAASATLAVVAVLPMTLAVKAFVALYGVAHACRAVRALSRIRSIRVDRDGAVEVVSSDAGTMLGTLRDGAFVAPWLTIVRWHLQAGRFEGSIPILPGMTDRAAFRELRILLRWR